MRHSYTRQAWRRRVAIALAAFLLPAVAAAGTVTVSEDQGGLSVDTVDSPIDEILAQIAQTQEFQIVRMGPAPDEKLSGQFSGSLGVVIARLLQNENHLIVHSAKAKAGIARIVLFGPPGKSDAAPNSAPLAVAARGRGAAGLSPQPLSREVIAPSAPAAPPQPIAKRPRS